MLSALLNWFKLIYELFQQSTKHSISAQTSLLVIKSTKAKKYLRAYCHDIYTVSVLQKTKKNLNLTNMFFTLISTHCCSICIESESSQG